MFRCGSLLALIGALLFATPTAAQSNHAARAEAVAADLASICSEDAGRFWGVSLCGPLIVVDPSTREAWANQPDEAGVLRRQRSGWVGVLPADAPIANSSITWSGVRWIMLIHVPDNPLERRALVAHEAWHRVQSDLGIPAQDCACVHLESERGRYWLRLELRALAAAMRSSRSGARRATRDALMFRAARFAEFPGAAAQEAALDRNEGLAAYTGAKLGAGVGAEAYAARVLDQHDAHAAFARAYAYASGPAYGLLLDRERSAADWRSALGAAAPADRLAAITRSRQPTTRRLRQAEARYGGASVAAEERARAEAQRIRLAAFRARFSQGPRLVLPLTGAQFEFNPNQVTPVEGLGSVYETLTIRDAWGELRASQGALIAPDFSALTVSAPAPGGLTGPGWSLGLTPAYRIVAPDAAGVSRIEPAPQLPPTPPRRR